MQSIPTMAVGLDFSLPMFAISHEHELGCYWTHAFILFLCPSQQYPNGFCSSHCSMSSMGPLPSTVRLVLSQLRLACSSHVPMSASSSRLIPFPFRYNIPLGIGRW